MIIDFASHFTRIGKKMMASKSNDLCVVGVVQRFGKYVRTVEPGLHFKFPRGIEKVSKVKVRFVYKEEFGFQSERGD